MKLQSKNTVYLAYYNSKMGRITLVASNKGLIRVSLPLNNNNNFEGFIQDRFEVKFEKNHILEHACQELDEFFAYKRKKFEIPFDIQEGTEFQRKVWNQLLKIPYGKTYSYKQIATMIDNPGAVRAVGSANKANPLPLFIPCHRCIGSNGALVGYAGNDPKNLKFKADLLQFEKNKNNLFTLLSKQDSV